MQVFPVDGYEFGLCLTHDVDRPFKGLQSLYYALRDRRPHHLRGLLPSENPWWTFERLMALERDLGVRSAFYFLHEPHLFRERPPRAWFRPYRWTEHLGRYDPATPSLARVIRDLDAGGWEVGLHGSLGSHRDADRLRSEKERLDRVLGHEVAGGRQHWLQHDGLPTWRKQAAIGLRYDSSLGSSVDVGFDHGYGPRRPFDDEFVVFPLTVMDKALFGSSRDLDEARGSCAALLDEARAEGAVMTVDWHTRVFYDEDFPGYEAVYRYLVEEALEAGAWVGPPVELYRRFLVDESEIVRSSSPIPQD